MAPPEFIQDGKVTEQGLTELHPRHNANVHVVGHPFTVEMIVCYVQGKVTGEFWDEPQCPRTRAT